MFSIYAFIMCLLGFYTLAFAKARHWKLLFPGKLNEGMKKGLQVCGAVLLLLALVMLKTQWGWALGLCFYAGLLSLSLFVVAFTISHLENNKPKRLKS